MSDTQTHETVPVSKYLHLKLLFYTGILTYQTFFHQNNLTGVCIELCKVWQVNDLMADGKKATVAEAHSDISAIFIIKPHGYATEESISDHLDT